MARHTCRRMASAAAPEMAWNRIGVVQVYRSEPIVFRKAVPPKPAFCNTTGPCILKPGVRPTARDTPPSLLFQESSALHERVCVCGTALPRPLGCGRPRPLERSSSRARTRLGSRRSALAHSGYGDHRVREDGEVPPLQRRKSQGFGARMDAEISTEFPRRWLRQQLCAQAPPSCPCVHGAAPCCSAR